MAPYDRQGRFDVVERQLRIVVEVAFRDSPSGVTMAYSVYGLTKTSRRTPARPIRFHQRFAQMDFGIVELDTLLSDDRSKFRVFDAAAKIVDKAFINSYMKWKRKFPPL